MYSGVFLFRKFASFQTTSSKVLKYDVLSFWHAACLIKAASPSGLVSIILAQFAVSRCIRIAQLLRLPAMLRTYAMQQTFVMWLLPFLHASISLDGMLRQSCSLCFLMVFGLDSWLNWISFIHQRKLNENFHVMACKYNVYRFFVLIVLRTRLVEITATCVAASSWVLLNIDRTAMLICSWNSLASAYAVAPMTYGDIHTPPNQSRKTLAVDNFPVFPLQIGSLGRAWLVYYMQQ